MSDNPTLEFDYTNHRGIHSRRKVINPVFRYGTSEFHKNSGMTWFIDALDIEKNAYRSFLLRECEFDDRGRGAKDVGLRFL